MKTFSALLALCEGTVPVSDVELWRFLWSAPDETAEQTIGTPVILDAIALIMTVMVWLFCIIEIGSIRS